MSAFFQKKCILVCFLLLRDKEVNDFLLYCNLKWSLRSVHQSAVNTHHRTLSFHHSHLGGAIRMHAAVVKEFSAHEEVQSFQQLRHTTDTSNIPL